MVELNSLDQSEQLELMEELSGLSSDILAAAGPRVGKFHREGKLLHRLRVGELRVYFEQEKDNLHCHYILKKNTLNDFVVRCKLPVGCEKDLETNQSFWEYLESLGKKSSGDKHRDKT